MCLTKLNLFLHYSSRVEDSTTLFNKNIESSIFFNIFEIKDFRKKKQFKKNLLETMEYVSKI